MKRLLFPVVTTIVVSTIAISPAQADFPMELSKITDVNVFRLTVPDRDTTVSAYGGKLRMYDVHIAKMVEVTHHFCRNNLVDPEKPVRWSYAANDGKADMGNFTISCNLAQDLSSAYGLSRSESTDIQERYRSRGGKLYRENIATLNIRGGKIESWQKFTADFKPVN
jgi:hypothetical protein